VAKTKPIRVDAKGPWVESWGYSRALRRGNLVEVSGTTAVGADGVVIAEGNVYLQTKQALGTIAAALVELGGSIEDVVRTRVYLRDIEQFADAGRAHNEVFAAIRPVSTCLGGVDFLLPEILVEVEASAVIDDPDKAATGA